MTARRAITRVLIANRGEIAVRIIRACEELGIETVLAASAADLDSMAAQLADRTICIGPPAASQSYLSIPTLMTAALAAGADALHPGYGFLAESAELAEACATHAIRFIGPAAHHIRDMGNKLAARKLAEAAGIPVLNGSASIDSVAHAEELASALGLPVMVKAAAGGGGRGMKIVRSLSELPETITTAFNEARSAFGDATLYLERYIERSRHIEVQVFGDHHGNVVHVGERDCSLQRRHQKLIEEAPAPAISPAVREAMREAALTLAGRIGYLGAGTVEFLYDVDAESFYFLEMNTRIQVEHPASELITGIDLIQEQFLVAAGEPLSFAQDDVQPRGHAIECRITAEDPERNFQPGVGRLSVWQPPVGPNIRVDSHCYPGYQVPVYYDSLLAKLIVYGPTRRQAITRAIRALDRFAVDGVPTTVPFLKYLLQSPEFGDQQMTTTTLEELQQRYLTEVATG